MRQGCNGVGEVYTWPYVEHDTMETASGPFEDGRTRQEFAAECDINTLLATYDDKQIEWFKFGQQPVYVDLTDQNVTDLASALSVLDVAQTAFMSLHARVRAEFDNDPVKFVAFAEDPANVERMREWGLAAPKESPEPERVVKVEVVTPSEKPA